MNRISKITIGALTLFGMVCCGTTTTSSKEEVTIVEKVENIKYGINIDNYKVESATIKSGETLGRILNNYGVSAVVIDRLDKQAMDIFPLRDIRSGNKYSIFYDVDSMQVKRASYLVYERNVVEYVRFGFDGDSTAIALGERPFEYKRQKRSATINTSLWGAIMAQDMPYSLAAELEEVYQWTVDFFGIQKGDNFTVIYDEKFIDDSVSVGIGRVWGAKFEHGGKEYYAVPFKQDGKVEYWEADGASLRKQMLKAPLKFSRISSKFSNARLHPIYKVYRPHHGVDYAAPSGTPVRAVADGTVTFKGWAGGGGNTLKIKHPGNLMTGYLHLRAFAKGIRSGSRVSQGDLIGYVGSTGASTGPHLDYRVWKGGVAINPLTIPQKPAVPIAKENLDKFEYVKVKVLAELNGDVKEEDKIMTVDSVVMPALVGEVAVVK